VRTLLQAGNMNMMAEKDERYKMDAVSLQEIQWIGKGSISTVQFTLHYSGNDRQGNTEWASSFQRKLVDWYWDFHPFLKEYVPYELKATSIQHHIH
jgi:uncharacterized protein YchJ